MKKEYNIEVEDGTIVFVNSKTGAEGGRFDSQTEAIKGLVEMTAKQHISPDHALNLYDKIVVSSVIFHKVESKKTT
jgi:major membrane immunogen (membrane-anchored lipoprotein)